MQDALILHGFWDSLEGYTPDSAAGVGRQVAQAFHDRLCMVGMSDCIYFCGVTFDRVDFSAARFLWPVYFNGGIFNNEAKFDGAQFFDFAGFISTYFLNSVFFIDTVFQGYANFESAQFCVSTNEPRNERKVVFAADFLVGGSFQDSEFGVQTTFAASQNATGAVSSKDLYFNGATFGNGVKFWNVSCKAISFKKTQLHKSATFYGFQFLGNATFESANFGEEAWFGTRGESQQRSVMAKKQEGAVNFIGSQFSGQLTFENIDFGRICEFNSAEVTGNFSVINCTFQEGLDLQGATIRGQIKLKDFDSTLNMRGATFVSHPPALFGSDLEADSDLACVLPKVPNTDHINIYEDLRHHAEKLGKLDDRKRFVHAELSCRAIDPNKSGAEWIIWWLYSVTSNYGTSVYRPLGWLLVLFLFSALPWVGYAIWFAPLSVTTAIGYNILQAVPFTGHMSAALLASDGMTTAPSALHFVAGALSLLNPIFWFLTGLGLRFQLRLAR